MGSLGLTLGLLLVYLGSFGFTEDHSYSHEFTPLNPEVSSWIHLGSLELILVYLGSIGFTLVHRG